MMEGREKGKSEERGETKTRQKQKKGGKKVNKGDRRKKKSIKEDFTGKKRGGGKSFSTSCLFNVLS